MLLALLGVVVFLRPGLLPPGPFPCRARGQGTSAQWACAPFGAWVWGLRCPLLAPACQAEEFDRLVHSLLGRLSETEKRLKGGVFPAEASAVQERQKQLKVSPGQPFGRGSGLSCDGRLAWPPPSAVPMAEGCFAHPWRGAWIPGASVGC